MNVRSRLYVAAIAAFLSSQALAQTTQPAVDEFRDAETGVRIVRMSRFPNERAGVIYFHQGSTTGDSKKALFHTQFDGKQRHLYAYEFATGTVTPLVTDRLTEGQDFSPRSHNVYYVADRAIWSTNIDTVQTRKIADLPEGWSTGGGLSVNADETLLASVSDVGPKSTTQAASDPAVPPETARLKAMSGTFAQKRPNILYTVDLKSGEIKIVHRIDTWLGHVQWSPTDPSLVMFCHEGPWDKLDRIWTYRLGDAEPVLQYLRTEPTEIAGHEFWSPDGKSIWFQNSFKGRKEGYLAGKDLATGVVTKYRMPPAGGGIHEIRSYDGHYFVADGGGKDNTGPNKYMSVLTIDGDAMKSTRLFSLQENDYAQSEPNPHLTPDQKWLIFTASFAGGPPQAWAAEMPEQYWRK